MLRGLSNAKRLEFLATPTFRVSIALVFALGLGGCPSPNPPPPLPTVVLGIDQIFQAADFNYADQSLQNPGVIDADNKVDANLAGATLRVRATMDASNPKPNHIWAAQLLGTTFTAARGGGLASRMANITFVFDDYAATEASAGDNSTADASYTINVTVQDGNGIKTLPVATGLAFDLHARAQNRNRDTQGGNQNKNQQASILIGLKAGQTYTAAIQAKADGTLKGNGATSADGFDVTKPYQLTLSQIKVHFK